MARQAAQFAPQVEHFLAEPELAALLRDAPQAGRLLRPLCRMLAIPVPAPLRLPARPPRPAPKARAPAVRPPRRRGLPIFPVGRRPPPPAAPQPA